MKKFLIMLIIILSFLLIYCFQLIERQSKIISLQNDTIKNLSPKFNGEDTLRILNLILSLNEFDNDTKLLDTSERVKIFLYPYLTKEYTLYKYNKPVFIGQLGIHPLQNQFMFTSFKLFNNDSASIGFLFNENRLGLAELKKKNGDWNIIKYIIGII